MMPTKSVPAMKSDEHHNRLDNTNHLNETIYITYYDED